MTKTKQIDKAIVKLRKGGTIKTSFREFHWLLLAVERYQLTFDLDFNVNISGSEIVLKGI